MASKSSDRSDATGPLAGLTAEDRALLERVANRVVALRMETPAILTLETGRPLSLLAGQAMVFFEPFVAAMLRLPDYRHFARLIERRETIEALILLIEAGADARERERRRVAAEKPATPPRP